jgi:hypothetical protein
VSWKKGQSGNPAGRLTKVREREYLDICIKACTREKWERICDRAVNDALAGDYIARKWLSDYIIGPPTQRQLRLDMTLDNLSDEQLQRIASGEDPVMVVALG